MSWSIFKIPRPNVSSLERHDSKRNCSSALTDPRGNVATFSFSLPFKNTRVTLRDRSKSNMCIENATYTRALAPLFLFDMVAFHALNVIRKSRACMHAWIVHASWTFAGNLDESSSRSTAKEFQAGEKEPQGRPSVHPFFPWRYRMLHQHRKPACTYFFRFRPPRSVCEMSREYVTPCQLICNGVKLRFM